MEELIYDIWLGTLSGLSAARRMDLMDRIGSPRTIFETPERELKKLLTEYSLLPLQGNACRRLLQKDLSLAKRCLGHAEKIGAEVISVRSEKYPDPLRAIKDPPLVLFALGDTSLLRTRCVAVVGTRRASPYGRWAAAEIGKRLTDAGVTVVSGMAEGVDSAAHRGCLQAQGKTIAVFGTGVDVCFPKSNVRLYEEIQEKGLLLSEYAFGEAGFAFNFPERNRIISGLSESCIVTEGAVKSGSLITAGLAAEQGRNVFALPGNINQPGSAGTNLLISEGVTPITSMDTLLQTLGLSVLKAEQRTDLSPQEKQLLKHVAACGSSSRQYIQETCGLPFSESGPLLTCLELKGLLRAEGSQVYVL